MGGDGSPICGVCSCEKYGTMGFKSMGWTLMLSIPSSVKGISGADQI
jgi:hypothetical protein